MISDTGHYHEAKFIVHIASYFAMSLTDLGVPPPDAAWTFTLCWDQTQTILTNGKRVTVHLWPDYKDVPYMTAWTDRVSKHLGSEEWMKDFGDDTSDPLFGCMYKAKYLIFKTSFKMSSSVYYVLFVLF